VIKRVLWGLSLVEVVLAVGLLTIIAVTIAGVFTHLLQASAKTSDLTAGRSLARRILDRAIRAGPPGWGFGDLEGSQTLATQDSRATTKFLYSITPVRLKRDSGMVGVTRELYFVEVEVKWWAEAIEPDPTRPEMGRLSTRVSQAVGYER